MSATAQRPRSTIVYAWLSVITLLLLVGIFLSPLDALFKRMNVITTSISQDGHHFCVIQWWNGIDFYSTIFVHKKLGPSNDFEHIVIAGDSQKIWRCSLIMNEGQHEVMIKRGNS